MAGQASAVVRWIQRGVPAPTATPPRLAQRGLRGAPTLVQNVETLAHLALIARYGAAWFRSAGTPAEPGTMLVTVLGAVREPGVLEIGIGTPVGQVLEQAGGASAPLQALLLGGYFGTWVDAAEALDRPFSSAGLADLGAGPGAGLIAALPADACGLRETARLARYLAGESAGQCGPCRFGLPAIAGEVGTAGGRPRHRPRPAAAVARPGRRPRRLRPPGRRRPDDPQCAADVRCRAGQARGRIVLRARPRVLPVPPRRSAGDGPPGSGWTSSPATAGGCAPRRCPS